jgi:hypothetical protein
MEPTNIKIIAMLLLTAQYPLGLLALPAHWDIEQTGWPSAECI